MMTYQAPDSGSMLRACQDARDKLLRVRSGGSPIRLCVDSVPHFVPGMGESGEWYRVGAVHLVASDHYLAVFLDAVTGQAQVEQTLMDVETHAPDAVHEPHSPRDRGANLGESPHPVG
jgi:hypothetical protein